MTLSNVFKQGLDVMLLCLNQVPLSQDVVHILGDKLIDIRPNEQLNGPERYDLIKKIS